MFENNYDGIRFYKNNSGVRFDLATYIIDTNEIVPYYMAVKKGEEQEYLDDKNWRFIGYGYCCNTTLGGQVSSDTEVYAFFNKN